LTNPEGSGDTGLTFDEDDVLPDETAFKHSTSPQNVHQIFRGI